MRYHFIALPAAFLCLSLVACNLDDDDTSGIVTLSGQVLDAQTNNPVSGAFIRVLPLDLLFEADQNGNYDFDVEIDSTMDLRVQASADGYAGTSTTVLALAGRQINVPTLRITKTTGQEAQSGHASNILLLRQSAQSIGVKESGSREVAQISFQLADSLGRPVILKNAAAVRFKLGVRPGGGEFIFPTEAQTDNNGQVTVNLSSGTRAGVVQVVAEADVLGQTIRSLPVSVAIHGGLPDQTHFSVGPDRFNFPGLRRYGLINPIAIVVGDQYGNPVKEGTAVYFTTSGGIIEGSVLTNAQGRGEADLISANPLPNDGVAVIEVSTADKDQNIVTSRTAVVFSGVPVVTISPTHAALNQTYNLTVTDQNGNPLAGGTLVTAKVEGTKVKAVGNTNVRIDDTAFIGGLTYNHILRGPGVTQFTFRAVEDLELDEDGTPTVESVTVLVTGPNGSLEIVLGADSVPKVVSKDRVDVESVDATTLRYRIQP